MRRAIPISILACTTALWVGDGLAATPAVTLYGVPLATATRAILEPALRQEGLAPLQKGTQWWYDVYRVGGRPPGASTLSVGYTQGGHFAVARYVFPSFFDWSEGQAVIARMERRYGHPTHMEGGGWLMPLTAVWNLGDGMEVKVSRGWILATTTLVLEDRPYLQRMHAQLRTEKAAEAQGVDRGTPRGRFGLWPSAQHLGSGASKT